VTEHDETVEDWALRIGGDLELLRRRVRGWGGVVARLAVLVDTVDELVDAGSAPAGIEGPLAQAREALVAGIDRIEVRTRRMFEDDLPADQRTAVVRAVNRYWSRPDYVPAIVSDDRTRRRWRREP
jgi:hypothetical protein